MGEQPRDERKSIEYDLTMEDVVTFQVNCIRNSQYRKAQTRKTMIYLAIPAVYTIASFTILEPDQSNDLLLACLWIVFFVQLVYGLLQSKKKVFSRILNSLMAEGENRNLVGRRVMTIAPQGVQITWPLGKAIMRWAAYERIVTTDTQILMYTGGSAAEILPRRAFRTPEECDDFVNMAKRYLHAHAPGRCKKCKYDLTGNVSGRCPECGEAIAPVPA